MPVPTLRNFAGWPRAQIRRIIVIEKTASDARRRLLVDALVLKGIEYAGTQFFKITDIARNDYEIPLLSSGSNECVHKHVGR